MYKIKDEYKRGTFCVFNNYKIIEDYHKFYNDL